LANYVHLLAKLDNFVPKIGLASKCKKTIKTLKTIQEMRRTGQLIDRLQATKFYPCANVAAVGSCDSGHTFGKLIPCGKEWCEYCGENHSLSHERRIFRWAPKVETIDELGYMVVTLPGEVAELLDRQDLQDFSRALVRYLKRSHDVQRGLYRWHWCGDCKACKGKGCESCEYKGTGKKFHPHINILFERGYMAKNEINEIKIFVAKWWRNRTGYQYQKAVVNYQYTNVPEKKKHILNYVTRATLRFPGLSMKYKKQAPKVIEQNEIMPKQTIAQFIKGFRSTNSWGAWELEPVPDLETAEPVELLERKICPCCVSNSGSVKKIHYKNRPVYIRDFYQSDGVKYLKGWFILPDDILPGEIIPPEQYKREQAEKELKNKVRANMRIQAKAGFTSYDYLYRNSFIYDPEPIPTEKRADIVNEWRLFDNN
jgi:hypothetical protein